MVRGQESQQAAIKRTAPHARWHGDDLLRVKRLTALTGACEGGRSNLAVINTSNNLTGDDSYE